jgi:phospholipid/cholesterol/gamma-HCH transport system substrate-binding protein
VLVLAGLAALVIGVFNFAHVGGVNGETVRLHVAMSSARGILAGSDVWLAGQKVGVVRGIEFRGVDTDTSHRLLVTLDVLEDALEQLRHDSYAQIRAGGSLLGASVVYLTIGTPAAPALNPGDTLTGPPQSDVEGIAVVAAGGLEDARAVLADLSSLRRAFATGRGSLGAMRDRQAGRELAAIRDGVGRTARSARSDSTIGGALRRDDLAPRVARISAALDSVRALAADTTISALGRFRRDSTILGAVADLRAELASVGEQLDEAHGSAGRILADSALVREVARVSASLGELFTDIRKRPLRYIAF